jgi:hypothetical protein
MDYPLQTPSSREKKELTSFFHIRGKALDALDNPTALNRHHFGVQLFGTLGGAATQVALTCPGANDHSGSSYAKPFRRCFMGLKFVLPFLLFTRHGYTPFTQNTAVIKQLNRGSSTHSG